jgi:nitric oxide reductase NorD protein
MGWQALLDWEEGLFRALLSLWRRVRPARAETRADASKADFGSEVRPLSVLAQALTAEPLRLLRARGAGGVRGADILLPASLNLCPDLEANRQAYRVQAVVASGMRRLTRGRQAPHEDTFEGAVESLRVARAAVELMRAELPNFGPAHDSVIESVLASRSALDVGRLPGAEAELELARRAALDGTPIWDDPDLCKRLVGPRSGRRRSPEVPIWGSWLPTVADASIGTPTDGSLVPEEPTTELDAPDIDALRRVDSESAESQDPVPNAPFERVESLDSYRGGARDLDGTDELEAHLDALEQVELGDLFRGSEGTRSLLRADLELGLDVADSSGTGAEKKGVPYDEWDARKGCYRKAWCTVYPEPAGHGDPAWAAAKLHDHRDLVRSLRRRLEVHRAGLRSAPRQLDGEEIDLEAAVDDRVARLAGCASNPRVYQRRTRRRREFATTVLLDVSMSTDSWVDDRRIIDVSREAALVLCEVAHQLEDRIQVLGFASETRNRCHVWEALGFGEDWSIGKSRISWLAPQGYTRIGPALRHATAMLSREPAERRLLLLISDGKPTDYDRYEGRYGIADVRRALREAERSQVHVHALAVDSIARDYLPALFGEKGWHVLPQPEALVEALTEVYGRLTAR